ncbi:hypothetical protein ACFWMG_27085 [Streptomyces sp. NPDC127074]|uniref:hypothetical protein n=1 Tax=Streptomyces sp. NPDC127074 TaxID=3347130 RepID=UPI00364EFD2D
MPRSGNSRAGQVDPALAGIGAGMSGLGPSYPPVFALLLMAGAGIAMFHPPAGRDACRKGGA